MVKCAALFKEAQDLYKQGKSALLIHSHSLPKSPPKIASITSQQESLVSSHVFTLLASLQPRLKHIWREDFPLFPVPPLPINTTYLQTKTQGKIEHNKLSNSSLTRENSSIIHSFR